MDGLSHWFKKGIGVAIVFLLWPGMAFGIPVCQVSRVIPGPPLRVEFTIQESKIGVKAINVIEKINASVQMTPFPPGFINPVVVTATKGNSTEALKVTLQAVDMKEGSRRANIRKQFRRRWTRTRRPALSVRKTLGLRLGRRSWFKTWAAVCS